MMIRTAILFCLAAGTLVAAALAADSPNGGPAGCARALHAELDQSSFGARDGGPPFTAAKLDAFRPAAETAFKAAADRLCAAGVLKPARIARFKRLLVQSGSGATEAAVYSDPESLGPDTLVFQWVFVEEGLALPGGEDIEIGIRCWADPDSEACAEREP